MNRRIITAAAAVVALGAALMPLAGASQSGAGQQAGTETQYLVLYPAGASAAEGRAAVHAAGGTVVEENTQVGLAVAASSNPAFVRRATASSSGLVGAARNRPVGEALPTSALDRERAELAAAQAAAAGDDATDAGDRNEEPLASAQWDMRMIGATPDGSYTRTLGRRGVLVGVIDTGIDGSHPDLAPNFDAKRSRNFTTDIPLIDGPCVDEADASCSDPADVDENGHGTHVAGTIAAAYNGLGISGIAPKVTLVNLRAGQDSGYFFLKATVDALTYAGDIGVDVVNMSFFVDPWLYNCPANPADSPAEQLEQRTIVAAVQRAVDYARARGVTAISALGNEHTDLGSPSVDGISPDFPPGTEKNRTVDNSCLNVPTELDGVISVGAVGPSGRKADYSNYGIEQTDLTAPGGWFRDGFGTPAFQTYPNTILSTTPETVARDSGSVAPDGTPTTPQVVRSCDTGGRCAYYRYEQGTSMAAPHVVGVAALIVSKYGEEDPLHDDGRTMAPDLVEKVLLQTARDTPCPLSGIVTYAAEGRPPSFDAPCVGNAHLNGLYGEGIVDALAAVTKGGPLVPDAD